MMHDFTAESPTTPAGFALWLRGTSRDTDLDTAARDLAEALLRRGVALEPIHAAGLAHALYTRGESGRAVALAVSMTVDALVRHGVVCLVLGGVGGSRELDWGRRKPERLLDVICLREGESPTGQGPFVVMNEAGNDMPPPDPPAVARVGEAPATRKEGDAPRWDVRPVLEALGKAGWIPPESGEGNGDDALIRQRLRDLGYL